MRPIASTIATIAARSIPPATPNDAAMAPMMAALRSFMAADFDTEIAKSVARRKPLTSSHPLERQAA